ncbi:hypothetical protein E2C01_075459 [Portunus trituberculatus]|uniref:Uncharacterized protein n=1 Tax=Portunus trituberculatus TaxID=210409 RepID=A0A5B7IF45_PORTR|nr:hypothetical protein [Portunus trituberculatus]
MTRSHMFQCHFILCPNNNSVTQLIVHALVTEFTEVGDFLHSTQKVVKSFLWFLHTREEISSVHDYVALTPQVFTHGIENGFQHRVSW